MSGPVRWGILGTGGITAKLLAGAARSRAVSVVAVGSRTQARADAFAAANGIAHAHGSYDDLLEDPHVEAVYISLPNALHHPWTMRSLAAGKHVLCEKPYTRHPAEVDEAFDFA
ncbi:MAG TPA: Gfo/Idh/MocA family oxidoreductase, partial [Patescibacteria group bacterium]|nr:Gfo/Idh/MocA family oxidoreductase [Patescibacteria group bacterium]